MRWNWALLPLLVGCVVLAGCRGKDPGIDTGYENGGEILGEGDILDGDYSQGTISFADDPNRGVVAVEFSPVLFGYDSFQIAPREMAKIEEVAGYLNENGDTVLIVQGHCDERGSREYNLSLGDRRALGVRTYLINLGIDSMRVQTQSFGEEKAVDEGHNEAAWRLNRRGEFVFYR